MENNFLEILNGMKLYMSDGDYGVEEVDIPIEYFVNEQIIDEAVRNLIIRFNKDRRVNEYNLDKLTVFKVKNNANDRVYLEMEYGVDNQEPIIVQICDDRVDERGFKIRVDSFLREIDGILNRVFAAENMRITEKLQRGEITREEWAEMTIQLASATPRTADQYMLQQAEGLKDYHEYITNFPEYKEMFETKIIVADIARDTVEKRRMPSGRDIKERKSPVIPFESRKELLDKYAKGKSFGISTKEDKNKPVYEAFIIEMEEKNGIIIVIEPIDGEKSTYITFETREDLEARRDLLAEMGRKDKPEVDIVKDVLGKTRSQKTKDDKIITKRHTTETRYKKNLEYIITGDEKLIKDTTNIVDLRNERANMLDR